MQAVQIGPGGLSTLAIWAVLAAALLIALFVHAWRK